VQRPSVFITKTDHLAAKLVIVIAADRAGKDVGDMRIADRTQEVQRRKRHSEADSTRIPAVFNPDDSQ